MGVQRRRLSGEVGAWGGLFAVAQNDAAQGSDAGEGWDFVG